MPLNIIGSLLGKDVDLMSPLITAFAQVTPAGNPKFAEILITDFLKAFSDSVDSFKAVDHGHDVNNWLCGKAWNRRAADMMNHKAIISKNTFDNVCLFFEHFSP